MWLCFASNSIMSKSRILSLWMLLIEGCFFPAITFREGGILWVVVRGAIFAWVIGSSSRFLDPCFLMTFISSLCVFALISCSFILTIWIESRLWDGFAENTFFKDFTSVSFGFTFFPFCPADLRSRLAFWSCCVSDARYRREVACWLISPWWERVDLARLCFPPVAEFGMLEACAVILGSQRVSLTAYRLDEVCIVVIIAVLSS